MKKNWKRELFSIPNILGYFRIALIPLYLWVYFRATDMKGYLMATGVIFLSGLTDCFDGKIARRFNMITEWGKLLDPIADKLTLTAAVVSLSFRFPLMKDLVLLYIVKEGFMLIMGAVMLRKGKKMNGAKWYGKVCTAYTYALIFFLLLIPGMKAMVADTMIIVGYVLTYFAFVKYALLYYDMYQEWKKEQKTIA